jgi:hypothetical protein
MVPTRRGLISRNIADSGLAVSGTTTNAQVTAVSEISMLITHMIGTTQYLSLLLPDVYDVVGDVFDEISIVSIIRPLRLYLSEIVKVGLPRKPMLSRRPLRMVKS